jgi:hypothetical protein
MLKIPTSFEFIFLSQSTKFQNLSTGYYWNKYYKGEDPICIGCLWPGPCYFVPMLITIRSGKYPMIMPYLTQYQTDLFLKTLPSNLVIAWLL